MVELDLLWGVAVTSMSELCGRGWIMDTGITDRSWVCPSPPVHMSYWTGPTVTYKVQRNLSLSIDQLDSKAFGLSQQNTYRFNSSWRNHSYDRTMYFVTEQFYQLPSEGIFSMISSLIYPPTKKNETERQQQPSLVQLHIAEAQRQNREDKRRRQGWKYWSIQNQISSQFVSIPILNQSLSKLIKFYIVAYHFLKM